MNPNPLDALIHSRKFLLAVAAILIDLIIALVPSDIAPRIVEIRVELIQVVTLIIGAVIGGIAYEDAHEKGAPTTVNTGSGDVSVTPPVSEAQRSGQGD